MGLAAVLCVACGRNETLGTHDVGAIDAADDANPVDGSTDAGDGATASDGATAEPVLSGLPLRQQYEIPIQSGHLGEVTIHGRFAYVANSWDSFTTLALVPDGSIITTLVRPDEFPRPRCTTLAIHEASSTMYCSSDESDRVTAYDIGAPEHPLWRAARSLQLTRFGVRDLAVVGDDLYLAQFDAGLWVSAIEPMGTLGAPVATAVTGNVRFVSADAGHLVALSADRGLLVLEGAGAAVTVKHELALAGTPQDLSVRGHRAAVALGSAGAVVVDLNGVPTTVASVRPLAVVTGADLNGELLALTTLTGAYLYDLSTTPPNLVGYSASGRRSDRNSGVMLSGRFAGTDFITSDWIFVERFATNRLGHVLEIDMPRGIYVPAGEGATIPFRNEGDVPFDVTARVGPTDIRARVGATETVAIVVPPSVLAAAPGDVISVTFASAGGSAVVRLSYAFRPSSSTPPTERPAVGDPFPEIHVVAPSGVVSIPVEGRRALVTFFARDCAAMWPVLEDAAYLGARGELEEGAMPFLLTESDVAADGYVARWALTAAAVGHFGYLAPPAVIAFNGSERLYEDRFQNSSLPRAASHPTNYLVSATGTVEAVDTYYRGAFPLR